MTVTYTGKVANSHLAAFTRLLFYWKGSIYKLMYKEMLIFITLYTILSLVYRFALQEKQKRLFEQIALHCEAFTNLIPLSFVLGFYVSIVVTRWWNQFLAIPWPDDIMMTISTMIEGFDEKSRLIRRTIVRYLSLSSLLVFQSTSVSVKKRFPTVGHLQEAGVLTCDEAKMIDEVQTPHGKWWVPFHWICNILADARTDGQIRDDFSFQYIMKGVLSFRGSLGLLLSYDWISIPLVYTQVTTLAVYTFFVGCLFGRQFLDPTQGYKGHTVDLYVPVFTVLQFFFYMGWIKVAEQLINPFGEDEDDFEMNWIIDRNLQISLLVVDDLYMVYPRLERDAFWGELPPDHLPYTNSTIKTMREAFTGSTAQLSLSEDDQKLVPMETIMEGVHIQAGSQLDVYNKPTFSSGLQSSLEKHHRLNKSLLANLYQSSPVSSRSNLDVLMRGDGRQPESKSLLQTVNGPKLNHLSVAVPDSLGSGLDKVESWLHGSSNRVIRSRRNTEGEGTFAERNDVGLSTPRSDSVGFTLRRSSADKDVLSTCRSSSMNEPKLNDLILPDAIKSRDATPALLPVPGRIQEQQTTLAAAHQAAQTATLGPAVSTEAIVGSVDNPDTTTNSPSTDTLSTIYEIGHSNQSTVNSMQQLLQAEVKQA